MSRLSIIELYKENMKFSAGHFTIFSASEREKMHGHNYSVHAFITTTVKDMGLSFDYRFYKNKIYQLCRKLNGLFLLPGSSPYLKITQESRAYHILFGEEAFLFPLEDVCILPLVNITIEELSQWFVMQLAQDKKELEANHIQAIAIKVFSSPGQCGSASWEREGDRKS